MGACGSAAREAAVAAAAEAGFADVVIQLDIVDINIARAIAQARADDEGAARDEFSRLRAERGRLMRARSHLGRSLRALRGRRIEALPGLLAEYDVGATLGAPPAAVVPEVGRASRGRVLFVCAALRCA